MDELDNETDPMHSIQEAHEEEELEYFSKGFRTGSSIEDDDSDDEFNKRVDTQFVATDARDDIDDMDIAGTKTQLQYENQTSSTLNRATNMQQYEEAENDDQNEYEREPKREEVQEDIQDQTIPVSTPHDGTQFTVHNSDAEFSIKGSATKFSVHEAATQFQPQETTPYIEPEEEDKYDQTTFSVQKVDEVQEHTQDEDLPQEQDQVEIPKLVEEEIEDEVIDNVADQGKHHQ